ncbi:L,D-transpeptidase family protein [Flavobacterium sp. GCM10023249]|uniref:L,D-transpeptidase family protein n=1 Tax=unclassified Flavobacterium TaxID=196869 RepID=UPI003613695C
MKYTITTIVFSIFLYIGCGNNSTPHIITTDEHISNAIENKKIQEGWDVKENRLQLIEAIKNANKEGLLPEDYQYAELLQHEEMIDSNPDSKEKYFELLTAAYIKYISHLTNGKVNPLEIYTDWEIKPKEIQPDTILSIALRKNKIDSTIESHKPKHTIYLNLKKALAKIDAMPEENFDSIKTKEKFKLGLKSKTVAKIKERLRYWGDLNTKDSLTEDLYNKELKLAVTKFQSRHGLAADGMIGPGTLKALNFSKKNRREQLIANLERWRWFPEDLGTNFLGVNIPNFLLYVVENNDTISNHKVVVGQPKRKTPILSSRADNIVFNPTWTVPPTIIKEDLIPDATKSRSYFSKTRIKIFNHKGTEIPVSEWKPADAKKYKYVQEPGYNNSLGVVKINFPNNHLVYMHDTNHRDYFVYNYRALSSGCVRIEKPLPLVEYLLKNKTYKERQKNKKLIEKPIYSLSEIDTIVKTKKTKTVKLDQNFGVHFLYFTAWYDKTELQFRQDIYNYDPDLYLRLSNQFTGDVVTSSRVIDK